MENKDKKGTSLPKPKIVKRVVPSGHVINTPSSGHSSGHVSLSPGQSSYSGLGPGRGPSASSRPQSPMSRPSSSSLSPASSNSISQNSSLHLAAQSRPSFPNSSSSSSRPAPAPSRPPTVNTEIMKRPLRYMTTCPGK